MGRLKNMLIGKRLVIALGVLLTVVAAPVAIVLMNQYMNTEATVSDALRRDARMYAAEWRIGLDEAIRRLQLQDTIGELGAALEKNESDTFAGLWVKHGSGANDFGAVVRFTQDGETTLQRYGQYVGNGPLAGMVEVRSADATLAELRARRNQVVTSLRPLGIPVESATNVRENKAEVYVVDKSRLESAMSAANVELPNKVELIKVKGLSEPMAEIFGGLRLTACTSGFGVEHSSGTLGITTAEHCSDLQFYNNKNLPYKDGELGGNLDLQWNSAPDFTVRNLVQDGSGDDPTREINDTKHHSKQRPGDFVCFYGRETGYRCGYIDVVDLNPSPKDICTDCTFSSGWVTIRKNNVSKVMVEGDSGGPVFSGNTALGTLAFYRKDNGHAVYMAVNHMSELGLTVLTD